MKIEEYIRKNRPRLDVEKADEDYLWAGISHSFIKPKQSKRFMVLKIAASVLLFIGLSYTIIELSIIRNNQALILRNIDPRLARQEAQFQKQINTYYNTLIKTNFDKDQFEPGFNELQNIDDMIQQYSYDLKKIGPNPKILNSLMDLYQKKILVLDRMLNEIEKNKNYENNKTQI
jgi:hypothetical protein